MYKSLPWIEKGEHDETLREQWNKEEFHNMLKWLEGFQSDLDDLERENQELRNDIERLQSEVYDLESKITRLEDTLLDKYGNTCT